MKSFITWAKSNPVSVLSLLVMVVCVGVLVWIHFAGQSFVADMAKRNADIAKVRNFSNTSVELPGEKPGDPPNYKKGVINDAVITAISSFYNDVSTKYATIVSAAIAFNRDGEVNFVRNGQTVLVEQAAHPKQLLIPNLLPTPPSEPAKFRARDEYWGQMTAMFGPIDPSATLPRLNAGRPVTATEVSEVLDRVTQTFIRSRVLAPGSGGVAGLSDTDKRALKKEKDDALRKVIADRAGEIHLYSPIPSPIRPEDSIPGGLPFDVRQWVVASEAPTPGQIWAGQMMFWIQQDIFTAIAKANQQYSSVIDAPVKALVEVQVIDDYIGIHGRGAIGSDTVTRGSDLFREDVAPSSSDREPKEGEEAALTPSELMAGQPKTDVNEPLPYDFRVGLTGRTSNDLYDVRQARVTLHVDYQKLGEFLDVLSRTNFITVVRMNLRDVDEYERFRAGYYYGTSDVWEVDLLLESVWFRQWTVPYMPGTVRAALGVKLMNAANDGEATGQ